MPSEALTLNLYEERYLALSEYVLKREPQRFGALHCSNKPQFVKAGVGPIVPMVDEGDVGVVCNVLCDEQAVVPTSSENEGLRRRINLQGLAVGRFRIEKVLHSGYGGGLFLCDGDENVGHLPFILVEAAWVNDSPIVPGSEEEMRVIELEAKLFASILGRDGTMDKMAVDLWGELVCDDEPGCRDECNLLARRFTPLLPSHLRKGVGGDTNSTQTRDSTIIELALYSGVNDSVSSVEGQRRQLSSFALSATVSPDKSVDDALRLLRSTSTYERLQHTYHKFKKSRSLLSYIKLML
jgi:Lon protease-like protein